MKYTLADWLLFEEFDLSVVIIEESQLKVVKIGKNKKKE